MNTQAAATVEQTILQRIQPTDAQQEELQASVQRLETAIQARLDAQGIRGAATIQGSIAKGTWLAGNADVDLFLLLDPTIPVEDYETIAEQTAASTLTDTRRKYAQHPYIIGTWETLQVDLVPACRVASSGERMSAVDRTPFHTDWVQKHLNLDARDQVRLLKQWMKGVGVYGAQTDIGGFSGYLAEVLIHHHGNFHAVLTWLTGGAQPRRIAPTGDDRVDDDVSPLIVVDPVDPSRNCAAAVRRDTLQTAQEAATAYLESPEIRFFFPTPAQPMKPRELQQQLDQQGAQWLALTLPAQTDRLDIVFPQFQKAQRTLQAALERAGFPVRRATVHIEEGQTVILQWILEAITLPASRIHTGPRADQVPNASRFRSKWANHPDALGPIDVDESGHLCVEVAICHRTAASWLEHHLPTTPLGKHVQAAVQSGSQIHHEPQTMPPGIAAAATELILDRRPWQRDGEDPA